MTVQLSELRVRLFSPLAAQGPIWTSRFRLPHTASTSRRLSPMMGSLKKAGARGLVAVGAGAVLSSLASAWAQSQAAKVVSQLLTALIYHLTP